MVCCLLFSFIYFDLTRIISLCGVYLQQFASIINARTAPEEYWKQVMKDQPMPDALKGLVDSNPSESVSTVMIKTDCHTSLNTQDNKHLANDILADPGVTVLYPDEDEKSFVMDFEPRPNLSVYHDGELKGQKKAFAEDFEPRPNVSVYHD
ncbi:hypothetical protein AQUCO_00700190v1 [Aquilegia coerulea]|uniref:Organ-specific protein S2 n=1 Tax=Aquilegia coerulea TaxID=218851 RepID=A0A2G5EJE1_AQUCA|nr:hypothetical protein AQUCO_00700190v1 [Aquilegia coerulea]